MLRSLALALSMLLAVGSLTACGRKSAPRLPEGEQLRTQAAGDQRPISVYSPYEEELEQIKETGDTLDTGIQEGALPDEEPDLVVEPPAGEGEAVGTIRKRGPGEFDAEAPADDLEVGEVAPPSSGAPAQSEPGVDPTKPLRRGLEDLLRSEEDQPPETDYDPSDQPGLPPSPGSPLEGGF